MLFLIIFFKFIFWFKQAKQLELLSEKGLGDAIREFVEKKENDAIQELVKYQLGKIQTSLRQRNTSEDHLRDEVSDSCASICKI